MVYANQTNISHEVEIFESLLTYKQGHLSLQAHFSRLQFLFQKVDLYQPPTIDLVTLTRYHEELYIGIYLSGFFLSPPIASQFRPTSAPRLLIMAPLTRPAYNFIGHNYETWASSFQLFLESRSLHHHLADDILPLCNLSSASWSQSNSIIITWMLHNIKKSIAWFPMCIKLVRSLWKILTMVYANQTNISHEVEIFESLLTYNQGHLSLRPL